MFDPSTDMPVLIETISQLSDLLLLVLDPVVMALPTSLDSHKNAETRHGLQPLVGFAEDRGIALVGVTHFTKGTSDREPIERVTGSLAFGAVPRIVWGASADDDGSKRRLVRIASNIGPSGGGIEFSLYQAPLIGHDFAAQRVQWGTLLRGGARELLNPEKQSKLAEAVDFLQTFLADGPQTQKDVKEAAGAYGHTWATIRTAQEKLAIKPHKPSKVWVWELPAKPVLFNLSDG